MDDAHVLAHLQACGTWRQGHFVFDDWRHAGNYADAGPLLGNLPVLDTLAEAMARKLFAAEVPVNGIMGDPKTSGELSGRVAKHLAKLSGAVVDTFAPSPDREEHGRPKLGEHEAWLVMNRYVVVVDAIPNAPEPVTQLVQLVNAAGGTTTAVAVILDWVGLADAKLGCRRFYALCQRSLKVYDVPRHEVCALCLTGVEVNRSVGHGADFERPVNYHLESGN